MQTNLNTTTKIFIQNVTLLDCAILYPSAGPKGKSWYVDVIWEGIKDNNGVLFDFSLAKKSAKITIDQEFDHKLIVSQNTIRLQSNNQIIIIENYNINNNNSIFAINTYNNSVKIISKDTLNYLEKNDISLLQKEIAHSILKNSPKNVNKVSVILREHGQTEKNNYFNYTHSLCHHYGNCQRFHGHSNIVEVLSNGNIDIEKSNYLAKKLDSYYIISKNYINNNWNTKLIKELIEHCPELYDFKNLFIAAQYKGTQGEVAIVMPKEKVLALDQESTIENLAEFMRNQFLQCNDQIEIRAYEGLSKGSICN